MSQDPKAPSIKLAQRSAFQLRLATALTSADPRAGSASAATAFIEQSELVKNYRTNPLVNSLKRLGSLLDDASTGPDLPGSTVLQLTRQVFGAPASDVIGKPEFDELVTDLRDAIVAVKFDQVRGCRPTHLECRKD